MDQETRETQVPSFEESHPWIMLKAESDEDDSLDDVIRYTLDELRFA